MALLLMGCKRDNLTNSKTGESENEAEQASEETLPPDDSVSIENLAQALAPDTAKGPKSSFGKVFTPKGDIKFLIIFAGFDSEEGRAKMNFWPADSTAIQSYFDPKGSYDPTAHFFSDNSQFPVKGSPANTSISSFFYEMSGRKMRVTADVFKNPITQQPERINISPDNLRSWDQANRRVMEKIKERFNGKFNWAPYDQRTNSPNYQFDNSITGPDGEPDYVIIVYRNAEKMHNLPSNFHASSRLSGIGDLKITGTDQKQYSFSKQAGFTYAKGFHFDDNLFLHELAHELFDCPHYFGTGNVVWNRFFLGNGISMMTFGEISSSSNAWETWYLGWLNLLPQHDLTPANVPAKPIVIRDFMTYRQPVRIAIPHTDPVQHLWIENRQRVHVLDKRKSFLVDNLQDSIPDPPTGLYLYVEDMAPDRKNPQALIYRRNNGMRMLHAAGNYDYTVQGIAAEERIWCNLVGTLSKRQVPNPLSGTNDIGAVPGNYPTYRKAPNCSSVLVAPPDDKIAYNGTNYNKGVFEHTTVLKKEDVFTYSWWAAFDPSIPGSSSVAFNQVGQGAGLSYNPPILPLQTYTANAAQPGLSPIYLNGLSVVIVDKRADTGGRKAGEEYLVEVRYNNTDISKDTRFTGNIVQQKVPGAANGYDVNVKAGTTLTIDKSGTPNRHLPTTANDFVNPTTYTVESGSTLHLEEKARLVIQNGSTFTLKEGAKIVGDNLGRVEVKNKSLLILSDNISSAATTLLPEIVVENGGVLEVKKTVVANYQIRVLSGGTLRLPANAQLSLRQNAQITVEDGGVLCVHPSAGITGKTSKNLVYPASSLLQSKCF